MKKIFIILVCLLIASPAFAFNKFMIKQQKRFKNSELVKTLLSSKTMCDKFALAA